MSLAIPVAVVVPCYLVKDQVLSVIQKMGPEIDFVICVDDGCPHETGSFIESNCRDPRVRVIRHEQNQGVGAAMVTGYRAALDLKAHVVAKIDGDGQMDPALISKFLKPILQGRADYTKGNRFYNLASLRKMPPIRLFGNAILSFLTKISSGYWDLFDPTNGFTAIHAGILSELPLDRLNKRYFFESDILFRLSTLKASVVEVPMNAVYGEEKSNLRIRSVVLEFTYRHFVNAMKRIFYTYFLRDFSVASLQLLFGASFFSLRSGVWD